MQEPEKPTIYVSLNAACLIGIIALSAVSQINASNDSAEYKRAILELDALAKINQYMIPASEQVVRIMNNYEAVQEFIYFENAIKANPEASLLLRQQQGLIVSKPSFIEAKQAIEELKNIAKKVLALSVEYPKLIPEEMVSWSKTTLKIKASNLNHFIDPYARHEGKLSKSATNYMEDTGKAFGVSVGKVRALTEKITSV